MKTYLVGPPGSGKTTRLARRLVELIERNTRPDRILVLVPQQAQANVFRAALRQIKGQFKSRGQPEITTLYGLAHRHVSLFFPLVAARAGFTLGSEPTLINVELAQYFLDQLLEPRSADFDDLRLYRPRLLGQIIDSMNKAAECGFGLDEIASRLSAAWSGDPQRHISFKRAQALAQEFRQFCRERTLLDFSLLIETYAQHLLNTPTYRDYITARYRHVIIDQIEENPPITHDFVRLLLSNCDSALIAEDNPGSYRLFLGADGVSARQVAAHCDEIVELHDSFVAPTACITLGNRLAQQFGEVPPPAPQANGDTSGTAAIGGINTRKFWSNMVRGGSERIDEPVAAGTPPSDIAELA
ncbi:MAG: UvrD-helicase domain-containing protein, partial [Anaerolineae bacterium]|nr:UvrD-helicase domain-containing protein [Anaerolineae bacterium]